ncbi:MAG: hypothetical protein Tsb0013_21010 [Phycisphaerales bacterium]
MTHGDPPHPVPSVRLRVDPDTPGWIASVPAAPGVARFETESGEPVTIVAGADMRRLLRARLDPEHATGTTKSLLGVAQTVRIDWAFSEAERRLVWLLLAREHLPRLAEEAARTPPCWFLRFDARESFPRATALAPKDLAALDDLGGVFGPYTTRSQAARAGEAVTDALDLCRHHHLLVQAPDASACAYKDMGRCPAPCDGSETMHAYRERVAQAQRWLAEPDAMRARAEEAMRRAAEEQAYEQASASKALLDRTAPLAGTVAGAIEGRSWVVLAPDAPQGTLCVLLHTGERAGCLGRGLTPTQAAAVVSESPTPPPPDRPSALHADLLGWIGSLACLPDDKNVGKRACRVIEPSRAAEDIERAGTDVIERASRTASIE